MSIANFMLDIGPPGGAVGAAAAIVFFLILVAVAFVAFKLLKKTVGMAIRVLVVLVVLAIAVGGTAAWFFMGSGGAKPPRPRPTQPK